MKLQALMIAVALAAGTAFAQAPNGTAKAPADVSASGSMSASGAMRSDKASVGDTHRKMHRKIAKRHHAAKHHAMARHHARHQLASAKHHRHHMAMASAHRHHHLAAAHHARAMGAGPASPSVDLNDSARQRRMDAAYNDWLRSQGRR